MSDATESITWERPRSGPMSDTQLLRTRADHVRLGDTVLTHGIKFGRHLTVPPKLTLVTQLQLIGDDVQINDDFITSQNNLVDILR
jgi:hypothetical protein